MVTSTTQPSVSSSSNTTLLSENCAKLDNYETLRSNNFQKINDYYNDLLKQYTAAYREYSVNIDSFNQNDQTYAKTILEPKTGDLNNQIINLTETLITNINTDTDLILEQKKELDKKNEIVNNLITTTDLIRKKLKESDSNAQSRNDNLNELKQGVKDTELFNNIYIGSNIVLLLSILGMIIFNIYKK